MTVGERLYFPLDEYTSRWAAVERAMVEQGYETAVIWQRTGGGYDRAGDVWYLTSYASHSSGQEPSLGGNAIGRSFAALLLRRGHEPELHICEPAGTVDPGLVATANIVGHDRNLPAGFAARLRELGIEGPVAYVGDDFLPAQMYRILLEESPQIEWVPEGLLLKELQRRKSPRELDLYREAGAVVSEALTAFMEGLIAGRPQSEAAGEAARIVVAAGGGIQRIACHSGPRGDDAMWNNPLYGYTREAPERGDLVRAWVFGPILHGYWIDPGRTSVCGGSPSPAQRTLIENSVTLTEGIIAACRPGGTPRDAGIAGDRLTEELGYSYDIGGAIWSIYGHGLGNFFMPPKIPSHGAETFEDDKAIWNVDTPFLEGEVYGVETFLSEPGVGMSGFEDIIIISERGNERLITTPMLFW